LTIQGNQQQMTHKMKTNKTETQCNQSDTIARKQTHTKQTRHGPSHKKLAAKTVFG